ncbi:SDR family oxidoreductase [Candidatus Gottesmanbacteria bacterium]|nr:SDR family oxidoreductase [Candidatus Gottesmanbacteria bacterium]
MTPKHTKDLFDLQKKVVIITGGGGLLGLKHAEAIAEMNGIPVLFDINPKIKSKYFKVTTDITDKQSIIAALKTVLLKYHRVDGLINNAANNPKVENNGSQNWSRLENFPLEVWQKDLAVGLTGAFLCSQIIGQHLVENGGGVILNISSDLGIIAPDQRIYKKKGLPNNMQSVKPITYSVIKHGLIGLTKYLATYWADKEVRVNTLCPGGVYNHQPKEFVRKLSSLIPLGRMASTDEYKAAIIFLISDASSYMTGSILVIDGGRTCW